MMLDSISVRGSKMTSQRSVGLVLCSALLWVGCKGAEVKEEKATAQLSPLQAPKVEKAEDHFADGLKAFDAAKYEEAETKFSKALSMAPQMVNAQYNLGVVAERM